MMKSDNNSKMRTTSSANNSMRQQQQSYGKLPAFDQFTLSLNKTLQRIQDDNTCSLGHDEFKQLLISSGSQERLKLILQALQLNNQNAIQTTKQKKEILNCIVTVAQTFKQNLQSEWSQIIELLESKLKDQDTNTYAALLNAVQAVVQNSFGKQKYQQDSSGIEEQLSQGNTYQQQQQQQNNQKQSQLANGDNGRFTIINGNTNMRSQTQPLEDLDENLDEESNNNININGIFHQPVHFTSLRQIYEQAKQTQQTQQQQSFAEQQKYPYVKLLNQDDSNSSNNGTKNGVKLSARSLSLKNLRDFLNLWFGYMNKIITSNLPIDLRRGICAASCLSISLQSVDSILVSSIRQEVCDQLIQIIEKSSQTQRANSGCNDNQVFDCLMSLALSQEELFQDCASNTLKLAMEHLRKSLNNGVDNNNSTNGSQNNDWQKLKVLIDLIYTLSVFTPEQLFPYFKEAERALNDLKTHRIKEVRNAAIVALQSLRELKENNNVGNSCVPQRDLGGNQGKQLQQGEGQSTVSQLDIIPRRENQQENQIPIEIPAASQQKSDQSPQQLTQNSRQEAKPSSVQNKMQVRNIELTRSYLDINKNKTNNMDAGEKRNEALPGLRRLSPNLSRAIHQVDESWRENEKRKAIKRGASPEFVNHGVKSDVEIYLPKKGKSPQLQSYHPNSTNNRAIARGNDLSLIDNQILQISAQLANCQQLLKQRVNKITISNGQNNIKRNSNSNLFPQNSPNNINGKDPLETKGNFYHNSKENKNPMSIMTEKHPNFQYFQHQLRNSNQKIQVNQGQFNHYLDKQNKEETQLNGSISKKQPEDDYQLNQNKLYEQRHPFQEWLPQQKTQQQQSPKLEKVQLASPGKDTEGNGKDKINQKISNQQPFQQQQQPQEDKNQLHNRIFKTSQSQANIPVENIIQSSPSNHEMSSSVGAMSRPLASIRNNGGKQEDQQQQQGLIQQSDPQTEENSPIQPQILQLLQSPVSAKQTNQTALTVSQRPFSISPERSQILMNGQSPGDQERIITRRQRQKIFEKSPQRHISIEDTQKLPVSSTSPSLRTKDRSMSELRRENQQLKNDNSLLKKQYEEGAVFSQKLLEKNEELRNQLLIEQQSKEVMRVFVEDSKDRQYSSQLSQVNSAIAGLVKQVAQERQQKEAVIQAMEEGKQEAQLFEGQLQDTIDSLKSQIELVRQKLQENYQYGQQQQQQEEEEEEENQEDQRNEGQIDNKRNEQLRNQQNSNIQQQQYWNNIDPETEEDGQYDKNEFDYDYSHNSQLNIPVSNREQHNNQASRQNYKQQENNQNNNFIKNNNSNPGQQQQQNQFFSFKNAANNSNHLGSISHNDSVQNRNTNNNTLSYLHGDVNHDGMIQSSNTNYRNTFNNNQPTEVNSRSSSFRGNNIIQSVILSPLDQKNNTIQKDFPSSNELLNRNQFLGQQYQQEQVRQSRERSKHERIEQTLSDLYSEQKREKGRFNNVQQQQQEQVKQTNSRYPNDKVNKVNEGVIKGSTTIPQEDHFDNDDNNIFGEQNNHRESVNVFFYETEDSQQKYQKQQQEQNNFSIQSSPKEKEEMDPIFAPPNVSKEQQYQQQQQFTQQQQPLNLQILQMKYNQQQQQQQQLLQQQQQQPRMQMVLPNQVEDSATSAVEQTTKDNLTLILTLLRVNY